MNPLAIAMAHPCLDEAGGAERIVVWLSSGLVKRGHRVEIFTDRYDPGRWSPPELSGLPVRVLQPGALARTLNSTVLRDRSLGRRLRRAAVGFDLLVVHNSPSYRWSSSFDPGTHRVLWYCEEPLRKLHYRITDRHSLKLLWLDGAGNEHLRKKAESFARRDARARSERDRRREAMAVARIHRLAANSAYTARNVEEIFGRPCSVCPCGVDVPAKPDDTPRNGFVLAIGPCTPLKNIHNVIEAVLRLNEAGTNTSLVVTGTPDEELARRVAARAADRVRFVGRVPDTELHALYARCALVAFLPVDEPFGLVAVEAMAHASPVVASNHGGPSETVVDGLTGLHADPLDPDDIAAKLRALLGDPERAGRMGEAGRRRYLENYTLEAFLDRFEAECHAAIDSAPQQAL